MAVIHEVKMRMSSCLMICRMGNQGRMSCLLKAFRIFSLLYPDEDSCRQTNFRMAFLLPDEDFSAENFPDDGIEPADEVLLDP
jgi:hypothetical protein